MSTQFIAAAKAQRANHRLYLSLLGMLFCLVVVLRADFSGVGLPEPFVVERARVLAVMGEHLIPDPDFSGRYLGNQRVALQVVSGPFAGQRVELENNLNRFRQIHLHEGMTVVVSMVTDLTELTHEDMAIYGPYRGSVLLGSVLFLCVVMVLIGRQKGLYAMVTLGFTLTTVVFFLVEAIVNGGNPLVYALLTALITTTFTLGMVSGLGKQTLASLVGVVVGLLGAGGLHVLVGRMAHVSGMHLDEAMQIFYHSPLEWVIGIPELFFATIIILASGVVVDTAISIASSVFEIKAQNPAIQGRVLYRSGMHIGGDILGANANTLILALMGAALPTVILLVLFGFSPLRILSLDVLAIQVVQSVTATMGMLVTIPATALVSAMFATHSERGDRHEPTT